MRRSSTLDALAKCVCRKESQRPTSMQQSGNMRQLLRTRPRDHKTATRARTGVYRTREGSRSRAESQDISEGFTYVPAVQILIVV